MLTAVPRLTPRETRSQLAAISPVGRAAGLEPLGLDADAHAARELYERHSPRVLAYCLSKLGRREDAEDAVQTTFLHAVRGLRRGVVPSVEVAWLLGIARNVCLSRFESAGRRGRLELVCDPVDLERSAAPQGRRDELIGLEQALASLPEQQRQAVLLRDWRGLSYEEVAAQLGVSLANAETLIFRGRRTLAELLDEKPSTIRRRLAGLGNLGSLGSALKTLLTGAAAASKIAAAVAVVAVSGAGVAAGAGVLHRDDPAPASSSPSASDTPDHQERSATTPAKASIAVAPPQRSRRKAAPGAKPSGATPSPAPTSPAAATPAADAAAPSSPSPHTSAPETPQSPVKVPAVKDVVPATTGTVQSTVDDVVTVLPELPVRVPPLPEVVGSLPVPELPPVPPAVENVVDTVVETVPPVTVTTPLTEPVTVDLPKLLP
jgi:RNA polymerase sigma-70 factor, ECF subfamily